MSEKIAINVGVFDVRPSVADDYNIPIGLSMSRQSHEGVDEVSVLLARQGHHDYLYDAYLASLSAEQRSCISDFYVECVDAVGFFNKTDFYPKVYCLDKLDDISPIKRMAAQALFVALKSHAHILMSDDGVMHPMRIEQNQLDAAIIQDGRNL